MKKSAVEELAVRLFEKMEELDGSGLDWADLTPTERLVFRASVEYLLRQDCLEEAVEAVRAPSLRRQSGAR